MPAIQITLCQQGIPLLRGFHIKDHEPTGLANEVIVKNCQWQGRITNKGIQDVIGFCGRQVTWRKGI